MLKPLTVLAAGLLLAGCGGNPPPELASQPGITRAQCDGYAARAIRTQDLTEATTLAAQASECYSVLRTQR